jgi:hypothetical protein
MQELTWNPEQIVAVVDADSDFRRTSTRNYAHEQAQNSAFGAPLPVSIVLRDAV